MTNLEGQNDTKKTKWCKKKPRLSHLMFFLLDVKNGIWYNICKTFMIVKCIDKW